MCWHFKPDTFKPKPDQNEEKKYYFNCPFDGCDRPYFFNSLFLHCKATEKPWVAVVFYSRFHYEGCSGCNSEGRKDGL